VIRAFTGDLVGAAAEGRAADLERVLAGNPRQLLTVHGPTDVSLEPVGDATPTMHALVAGNVPETGSRRCARVR
ncbi:hypothetical protein, partial [Streptomyces sp. NPDC005486]|uniref:hypothetical protein n=1 Tax=Streptomyces sp. NPDC005486 TaxID=3155345 RepID=UPI0033A1DCB0